MKFLKFIPLSFALFLIGCGSSTPTTDASATTGAAPSTPPASADGTKKPAASQMQFQPGPGAASIDSRTGSATKGK